MNHDREETTALLGAPYGNGTSEYLVANRYDPGSSVELVNHIIETVATAEGVAPTELTVPLYEAVDVDAIESLFTDFGSATAEVGHVTFAYDGHEVTVRSDGFVGVT